MTSRHRNISLRGLRAFCCAAEHERFRDAADRLFVTASAVCHQIKNPEKELGLKLFDRTTRSLVLTDAGRALLDEVKPLIGQLDAVASRHSRAESRSTLSISVQPFFANELLIPRLPEFTPGITTSTSRWTPVTNRRKNIPAAQMFRYEFCGRLRETWPMNAGFPCGSFP